MTKEEIIEMAKQAGAMFDHMTWVERDLLPMFERFAKLVAEHEREKCAKIAEWHKQMAFDIRARGQE
jgi:hypothetical protein